MQARGEAVSSPCRALFLCVFKNGGKLGLRYCMDRKHGLRRAGARRDTLLKPGHIVPFPALVACAVICAELL